MNLNGEWSRLRRESGEIMNDGMASGAAVEPQQAGPLRVAVVDNDMLTAKVLVQLLPKMCRGVAVPWWTTSGSEALAKTLDPVSCPQMLIADMSLGEISGLTICRRVRETSADVLLLGVTSYYAERLVQAGAQGLADKAGMQQLVAAVDTIRRGGTFVPAELAGSVSFDTAERAHERLKAGARKPVKLSDQESRIIDMLSRGLTYADIAERLAITQATARTYAHRAEEKLGAATLAQAVAMWVTGEWA